MITNLFESDIWKNATGTTTKNAPLDMRFTGRLVNGVDIFPCQCWLNFLKAILKILKNPEKS